MTDEDARDCLQKFIDATYPDDGDKSGLFFLLTDWLTRAVDLHPTSQAILDNRREWIADKPPALLGAVHLNYRDAGFPNTTPAKLPDVPVPEGWVKVSDADYVLQGKGSHVSKCPQGDWHFDLVCGASGDSIMGRRDTLPEAFAAAERMHAVWGGGE